MPPKKQSSHEGAPSTKGATCEKNLSFRGDVFERPSPDGTGSNVWLAVLNDFGLATQGSSAEGALDRMLKIFQTYVEDLDRHGLYGTVIDDHEGEFELDKETPLNSYKLNPDHTFILSVAFEHSLLPSRA